MDPKITPETAMTGATETYTLSKVKSNHPEGKFNKSSSQKIVTSTSQSYHPSSTSPLTITMLPYDIIELIFKQMTPENDKERIAASDCLKNYHRGIIWLTIHTCASSQPYYECASRRNCQLAFLLEGWVGDKYRLDYFARRFLSKAIYGIDFTSEEEDRWLQRDSDYRLYLKTPFAGSTQLPNPYNMGRAWDEVAIRVIKDDLANQPSREDWISFWEVSNIFDVNRKHFRRFQKDEVVWEGYYLDWALLVEL